MNALFGSPLSKEDLVVAGLRSEARVSGYHADNVGPALLGGFVLIRSYNPLEILRLPYPEDSALFFVVASPAFEAPTKAMRAALPTEVCYGFFPHIKKTIIVNMMAVTILLLCLKCHLLRSIE